MQEANNAVVAEDSSPPPQPAPAATPTAPPSPLMVTVQPQHQQRQVVVQQQQPTSISRPQLTLTPAAQPPTQQPHRNMVVEHQQPPSFCRQSLTTSSASQLHLPQQQQQRSELFDSPTRRVTCSPILPPVVDSTPSVSATSPEVDLLSPPPTPTARRITFDDHSSASS